MDKYKDWKTAGASASNWLKKKTKDAVNSPSLGLGGLMNHDDVRDPLYLIH